VVVDRPEVERRAEAGEVAGVGRRVHALPLQQGQTEDEGVARVGGVDVEIAEEDLRGVRPGGLAGCTLCDELCRQRLRRDLAAFMEAAADPFGDPRHHSHHERQAHAEKQHDPHGPASQHEVGR
jgi:hypothetical protein